MISAIVLCAYEETTRAAIARLICMCIVINTRHIRIEDAYMHAVLKSLQNIDTPCIGAI